VGQATYDNIIRRMGFACWVHKATDTHSEYVILIAFRRQKKKGYANAPHCDVIGTLFLSSCRQVYRKEVVGWLESCQIGCALWMSHALSVLRRFKRRNV
jgi:hypothetical protein